MITYSRFRLHDYNLCTLSNNFSIYSFFFACRVPIVNKHFKTTVFSGFPNYTNSDLASRVLYNLTDVRKTG